MAKPKDITGQKFQKLTAIERIISKNKGPSLWKFLCECGQIVERTPYNIISGSTQSCGCILKQRHLDQIKDITNKKIGKLTALRSIGKSTNGGSIWECLCDCGKIVSRQLGTLMSTKRHHSCGCDMNKYPEEEKFLRHNYSVYKGSAVKRKLDFKLTFEDFSYFTQQNCVYCNGEPTLRKYTRVVEGKMNGIDRFDNTKGYTAENCYSCCPTCNAMKSNMAFEDFKDQIIKIYNKLVQRYE